MTDKATDKQINYINILAGDLQLDLYRRNKHIAAIVGYEIHFLDELTKYGAIKVIEKFKEWKENKKK